MDQAKKLLRIDERSLLYDQLPSGGEIWTSSENPCFYGFSISYPMNIRIQIFYNWLCQIVDNVNIFLAY